jgi:hypothetical protein
MRLRASKGYAIVTVGSFSLASFLERNSFGVFDLMKALQQPMVGTIIPRSAKPWEGGCCSMRHLIGCDAHKKYSVFVALDEAGNVKPAVRVNHDREQYQAFLRGLPPGSVAGEALSIEIGNFNNSQAGKVFSNHSR